MSLVVRKHLAFKECPDTLLREGVRRPAGQDKGKGEFFISLRGLLSAG